MYAIGQKFEETYPPEAAQWANENGAMLVPVDNWFEIQTVPVTAPNYKAEAQTALDKSDTTVLRCLEKGIAIPSEWTAYRAALRAIVASGSEPLPARPAYPAGS